MVQNTTFKITKEEHAAVEGYLKGSSAMFNELAEPHTAEQIKRITAKYEKDLKPGYDLLNKLGKDLDSIIEGTTSTETNTVDPLEFLISMIEKEAI